MERYTEVSIKEANEHGYGFTCKVSVDPHLPEYVSFDIAWEHTDDEDTIEEIDSVGVIMTADAARAIAERLQDCAYRIESNKKDATTNG